MNTQGKARTPGKAEQQAVDFSILSINCEKIPAEAKAIYFDCLNDALNIARQTSAAGKGYRSPMWEFTFQAKGYEELHYLSYRTMPVLIDEWLQSRGYYDSIEKGWVQEFDVNSAEDGRIELMRLWREIRFAPGFGPLEYALEKAHNQLLNIPEDDRLTSKYVVFLSLAGWLQYINPGQNIYLPTHKLGTLLELTHDTIATYCKFALEAGYLRKVAEFKFSSQRGQSRATEYQFDVSRFPELNT